MFIAAFDRRGRPGLSRQALRDFRSVSMLDVPVKYAGAFFGRASHGWRTLERSGDGPLEKFPG